MIFIPGIGQMQTCRHCGCTDMRACPGGCFWVSEDLCSACVDKVGALAERTEYAWSLWLSIWRLSGARP